MKLIEGQTGKDGNELPAAESCALDEGEEEETDNVSDRVIFARGGKKRGGGIFGRSKVKATELTDQDIGWGGEEKSAFMFEKDIED